MKAVAHDSVSGFIRRESNTQDSFFVFLTIHDTVRVADSQAMLSRHQNHVSRLVTIQK